ncbi:MAG: hypothetical protein AAF577_17400 [Pseudomonadota bacterium]
MFRVLRSAALSSLLLGCAAIQSGPRIVEPTDMPGMQTLALAPEEARALRVEEPVPLSSMALRNLKTGEPDAWRVTRFGNGIRVREADGCTWTRISDWFAPSDSWAGCGTSRNWHTARAQVRVLDPIFPLQLGATGRYERRAISHTDRLSTRTTECRVTEAVALRGANGQDTPALVAVCNDGRLERTTWYAPERGPIAYREVHLKRGPREAWLRD